MNGLRPAEQLLQELGVSDPRDIDLDAIAFDQGAEVRYRSLQGCEARIVGFGDHGIITINPENDPARIRFSIAHELGHWHRHRGRSLMCRSDEIGNPSRSLLDPERVADSYAGDLLLPRYLFMPCARALRTTSFESLKSLADEFSTSLRATAIRLVEYGPEPAMLVCHNAAGRRWFNPGTVPKRWFPRQDLDADSYAFDVLHGDSRHSRRVLIGADAWFDRHGADRFEIYEQSFKVGNDEILTFLVLKDEEMLGD